MQALLTRVVEVFLAKQASMVQGLGLKGLARSSVVEYQVGLTSIVNLFDNLPSRPWEMQTLANRLDQPKVRKNIKMKTMTNSTTWMSLWNSLAFRKVKSPIPQAQPMPHQGSRIYISSWGTLRPRIVKVKQQQLPRLNFWNNSSHH